MIGKQFGFKIKSSTYEGYIYVLEPTPDLWSHALDHRTQIVDRYFYTEMTSLHLYYNRTSHFKIYELYLLLVLMQAL